MRKSNYWISKTANPRHWR